MRRPPQEGQNPRFLQLTPRASRHDNSRNAHAEIPLLELLLHEIRQRPIGRGAQLAECGIVLLDELVQQRPFRPVLRIAGRIEKRRRRRSLRTGNGGHDG
jgi:hypothetical protein